jgi:peptidoglycan/LPS O-acetylase OafA/YrhL
MFIVPIVLQYMHIHSLFDQLLGQYLLFASLFAFLGNFWFFFSSGHANLFVGPIWSLCIEEQFYLSWPWLVKNINVRRLIFVLSFLPVICLVVRYGLFKAGFSEVQIRMFTFGRLDAIGGGALLYLLMNLYKEQLIRKRRGVCLLLVACLLIYFYLSILLSAWIPVFGCLLMAIICAMAVFVVLTAKQNSFLNKLFSAPLLVAFGKYSYSIYLLHMVGFYLLLPLFVPHLHSIYYTSMLMFFLLSALMFFVGVLIYRCFERHFLALKNKLAPH